MHWDRRGGALMDRATWKRLWVLMATVLVDMLGFFIVLPLLPFYAERLGADPFIIGALISTFAFAQLVSAPIWGKLSDRYGRRPAILGGLAVAAVAYFVFGLADSVWLLFLSRFVQGAGGGTVAVVQAYVSDSVPRRERAKALGWMTAAASAGVTLGPAVGSLATGLGVAAPGFMAAGLCVLNGLFAWRWLPESSAAADRKARRSQDTGAVRKAMLEVLRSPRGPISSLIWIYAAAMMAFMAMNGVIALYLQRRFGVDVRTIGWLYVYVGAISVVMRTVALGPAVRRFGEQGVLKIGALTVAFGLAVIPLPGTFAGLALAVALVPIGTALLFPATTSMVSHRAPEEATGLYLGVQQSFGGIARMVGPLWAGLVFKHQGISLPFWLAAGIMVGTYLFAVANVAEEDDGLDSDLQGVEPSLPGEV